MGKYDGTVRIDTRIDTGGFNKGISKIGTAMRGLGAILSKVAIGAAIGFAAILFVLSAIVRGIIAMGKAMFEVGKDTAKYATKIEELKSSFANLKLALTDAFRPLVLFALPWIQQLVSWVSALLSMIAQVIAGLTGQSGYWKSTTKAASGAADATEKIAENTKKAGEAAEGALAAFDDIDVLQMAKEQDTSTGGGATGGGAEIAQEWIPLSEKALGIIEKIKEAWAGVVEFFEPILEPLGRIWDAFKRIWEQVKIAALAIWDDLTPAFEWFRDNVIVPILDALATLFENIATWAEENPEQMKGVVAAFMLLGLAVLLILSPVAQVIAIVLVLITIIGLLIKYWPEIKEAAIKAWNAVVEFFREAGEWIKQAWSDVGEWIKNTWNNVIEWINKKIDDTRVWIVTTLDNIKSAWDNTMNGIRDLVARVSDSISTTIANLRNSISNYFRDAYNDVTGLWGRITSWFDNNVIRPLVNTWDTSLNAIRNAVSSMTSAVYTLFSNLSTNIRSVWNAIKTWFQTYIIDPLVKAWSTATTSIGKFFSNTFEGVKNTVKNVINSIIDFLNAMISRVTNGVNNIIGMVNLLPGVNLGYVTAPQIPRLATGAVIPPNAAFMAVLGDQRSGTNIEAPEDLIRQIVREETGSKEVTINFAGSLGALVRELKPYIDKENNRIGRSLVKGVSAT